MPRISKYGQIWQRTAQIGPLADMHISKWSHIGRIVFAGSNDQLLELTGPGNKENFTMDWHTRDILRGCPQKDIEVIGPLEEEGKVVMQESDRYWSRTRIESDTTVPGS